MHSDPSSLAPFSCTHTPGVPELMAELGCSLVISTYQAGKVIYMGIEHVVDGNVELEDEEVITRNHYPVNNING